MAGINTTDVFSVVIFFIAFREAMEASLIIGTLLGMMESLARDLLPDRATSATSTSIGEGADDVEQDQERIKERRVLIKKLRKMILLGAATGLGIAMAIGAVFLAVFYTQANDLYAKADEAWESAFNLVAMILITPMALALLRADRSRGKWRAKLAKAFAGKLTEQEEKDDPSSAAAHAAGVDPTGHSSSSADDKTGMDKKSSGASSPNEQHVAELAQTGSVSSGLSPSANASKPSLRQRLVTSVRAPFLKANRGRTTLFTIPLVTTLREGLEGVVFIGGVSLGLPATSIPLAAIVGLALGLSMGFIIFKAGGFSRIRYFLLLSTCLLLLIAAGMASRAVWGIQYFIYGRKVGDAAAEGGSGPGSYDATNYIWHIDCCNPNESSGGNGWGILNSLVGWNNTGTYGSIFAYIAYWFVVIGYMIYSFWVEGRLAIAYRWKGKRTALWESKKCVAKRQRTQAL